MEKLYQHILVAIDLSDQVSTLLAKSLKLAAQLNSSTTILHVIEFNPAANHIFVNQQEYKQINFKSAKNQFKSLGVFNYINDKDLQIEFGPVKKVILNTAEKLNCDLIIVGSHGRHGIHKILGSTSNAVLHGADRDVFVIRYE